MEETKMKFTTCREVFRYLLNDQNPNEIEFFDDNWGTHTGFQKIQRHVFYAFFRFVKTERSVKRRVIKYKGQWFTVYAFHYTDMCGLDWTNYLQVVKGIDNRYKR